MVRFRNSNNDDDDDDDLDETSFMDPTNGNEEQAETVPLWDTFQDIPDEFQSGSMADTSIYDISVQIIKVLAYVVTFCVVLFGAAIAKTLLLLMTSQLSDDRVITIAYDGRKTAAMEIPYFEKVQYIWALLIAYSTPELIGTFVRSLRMVLFKGYSKETKSKEQKALEPWIPDHVLVVTVAESLQTIGMALLVFEVLPQLDVVRGIMLTNCVCLVPGLLSALSYDPQDKNDRAKIIGDGIAVALQFTGLIAWPIIESENGNHRGWFIPLALLLISCGWWINFVSSSSRNRFIQYLGRVKDTLHDREILLYNTYVYVSVWKVVLFFCTTLIILLGQGHDISHFFDSTVQAFEGPHVYNASRIIQLSAQPEVYGLSNEYYFVTSSKDTVWWILGAQALAAYLCYVFGKFACKILIQPFSFAFPSILVVPVTVLFFVVITTNRDANAGFYDDIFPSYLFFNTPRIYDADTFFAKQHAWVWIFWIVSQIWITLHTWFPRCGRLARTEKLFSLPMYSEFLVEQSICLNRRRDEIEIKEETDEVESDKIPHIIACATMWHEEKTEMLAMLKSVLRLDDDQCARRLMKETLNNSKADINYYTYETHIFFDDAFAIESEDSPNMIVNKWVKDFVDSVEDAVHEIHNDKIDPPIRYPTPYGGRLEYTLPGKTMLYVHLKNKDKIRHRKRWSQVMYMYYLLGYRLMELPISQERKELRANNTFLLALDGDIDFNAKAVTLLVDLMKKNDNLGAACGRIHPVGAGPMAWYQIFEYAIGHWLQKATEHMIGCVLCSPGCFSLFRAKALMDDNVMKRYTFKPQEARHHVQYDQGEDRWLCTLLLQRGYRVEYSAASDAYTHCPESFNEFYNQRRRWVPSTMANILDLLESYKMTIKINNNISFSYIVYQMMLLGGTILGPGTIFLMLVGAFNAAFKVDNWTAFYLNLVPIVLYILFCLFLSSNFQLTAALIISSIYGLVMMAVLVGILIQIEEDGPLAPSTLFLFIVAGEIIVAGLFHPQEWYCLPSGAIYYVTIPSMYLLLIIYSVCNLNNISWGTRDVAVKKTKAQMEAEQKELEEAKKKAKQNSFFGFLETYADRNKREEQGSIEFSLAGLFKCLCCVSPKPDDEKQQLIRIADTLGGVKRRLENIEKIVDPNGQLSSRRRTTSNGSVMENRMTMNPNQVLDTMEEMDEPSEDEIEQEPKEAERDDLINPYWIEDKDLRNGKVDHIGTKEVTFWQDLIAKYLYPLTLDKSEKQKVEQSLKDLRDKMVLAFFMINALFVVVLFLLQLNKDTIFLNWPLGAKTNITYDELSLEIEVEKSYLKLEPFGLVFVIFFAIILVIQFTGMMFHRFETLCHLLSTSTLTIFGGSKELSQSQRIEAKLNEAKKQKDQKVFEEAGLDTTEVNNRKTVMFRKSMAPTTNRQSLDLDAKYKAVFNQIKENEENAQREKEERRRSSAGVGFMNKVRNSIAGGNRSSFAGGIRNSFAGPRSSFAERNKNLTAQNYPSPRVLRKTVAGKLEPKMADFQTITEDDSEVVP